MKQFDKGRPLKLYSMSGSRYAARCHIQIRAKGLEVEVENVPYPVPDWYRDINPLGLVPALDTGKQILAEAAVICEYLEDLGIGPSLRPDDAEERTRMRFLVRILDLHVGQALLPLYGSLPGSEAPGDDMDGRVAAAIALLEPHLPAGKFALGGGLTLADCALMPILLSTRVFLAWRGLKDRTAGGQVGAYFEATRTDAAVAAVLDPMEKLLTERLPPRPLS